MSDRRVGVADLATGVGQGTLSTIGLGSCVAIALYDARARVGGMAHILLPEPAMSRDQRNPARFPETAVPALLERMVALGADPGRVVARIAGGASMFASLVPRGTVTIGTRNVEATRRALAAAGLRLVGEDVGDEYGRSVYLHLGDGRVEVRSLSRGNRDL
ncbi:MAG: chemotaxis protein CheD [Gemmatimonadaceae bacterium]